MKKMFGNNRGFTLIELIIVVIIIGILAAFALPQFTQFTEKARTTEALNSIGLIKTAEIAAMTETGNYVACATAAIMAGAPPNGLNITLPAPAVPEWAYATTIVGGATVTITATRNALSPSAIAAGTINTTIIMTYTTATGASVWTGTHPGRPR